MSDKKQTAVEWLFEQLKKDIIGLEYDYADELSQAKAMEKEQIINAWCDGNDSEPKETPKFYAEQYITQTFQTNE